MIHPGGKARELTRDDIEVDVMERTGVRVGAERGLSARMALPLRDPRRQIEDAGKAGEVWSLLVVVYTLGRHGRIPPCAARKRSIGSTSDLA